MSAYNNPIDETIVEYAERGLIELLDQVDVDKVEDVETALRGAQRLAFVAHALRFVYERDVRGRTVDEPDRRGQ